MEPQHPQPGAQPLLSGGPLEAMRGFARHGFDGGEYGEDYLTLVADEPVTLLGPLEDGWAFGRRGRDGGEGWMPEGFFAPWPADGGPPAESAKPADPADPRGDPWTNEAPWPADGGPPAESAKPADPADPRGDPWANEVWIDAPRRDPWVDEVWVDAVPQAVEADAEDPREADAEVPREADGISVVQAAEFFARLAGGRVKVDEVASALVTLGALRCELPEARQLVIGATSYWPGVLAETTDELGAAYLEVCGTCLGAGIPWLGIQPGAPANIVIDPAADRRGGSSMLASTSRATRVLPARARHIAPCLM